MRIAAPLNPKGRPQGWGRELIKERLRPKKESLRSILISLSSPECGWRGLYADVVRWRADDPELDTLIKDNAKALNPGRGGDRGGRPRKDDSPELADWRRLYCEEYSRTHSRNAAALVTPYKPDEIYRMLSTKYKEYDKDLAEMVHMVDLAFVARAAEIGWTGLEEISQSGNAKDKVWAAVQLLKHAPGSEWNPKLNVEVSGTVVNKFEINRQRLIGELVEDQRQRFNMPNKQLEAGVVDVEEVSG